MSGSQPEPIALPFQEAIDYLLRKLLLPTARWTDLWQEQHAVAFTVAGATSMGIVQDFFEAVTKAIAEGGTLQEFRRDFDAIVERYGWTYNGSRGWRSRVIFETNLRMAYSAGKWQQAVESQADRPYLRYSAVLDGRTRPLHRKWHGTILPIGDAWWRTHTPPNGWNCRCTVMTLSERDLERRGWTVSGMPEGASRWVDVPGRGRELVPDGIDPGFAYNPGEANLAVRAAQLAQRQADRLPEALRDAGKATMAEAAQRAAQARTRPAPPAPQ